MWNHYLFSEKNKQYCLPSIQIFSFSSFFSKREQSEFFFIFLKIFPIFVWQKKTGRKFFQSSSFFAFSFEFFAISVFFPKIFQGAKQSAWVETVSESKRWQAVWAKRVLHWNPWENLSPPTRHGNARVATQGPLQLRDFAFALDLRTWISDLHCWPAAKRRQCPPARLHSRPPRCWPRRTATVRGWISSGRPSRDAVEWEKSRRWWDHYRPLGSVSVAGCAADLHPPV